MTHITTSDALTRAVTVLTDLVGFNTVSSNSNLDLMRYVTALLAERGITAALLLDDSGRKANLFARIGPDRPNGVVLSGHTDVVPVTDQPWTSDPFVLTQRGSRLYGRGSADMKSFIACCLAALDFNEINALKRPVHLAFSYDEEVGCLGAPPLIDHIRATIAMPAVVIVGEPSLMRIMGSHKSVNIYKVKVTGVPAHSSLAHLGLSANALAIRLMSLLLRIADGLMAEEMCNADFQPPFSTLTIGMMQGGTAANILAAEASFLFDLRSLPEHDAEEVLRPFLAEIDRIRHEYPAATVSFEPLASVPPLARVQGSEAEAFVRLVGGDNADLTAGSFGAEAGQFQRAGFSTVICGPGSIDQAHQTDEYIEIGEIEKGMLFMNNLFAAMCRPEVKV